MTAEVLAATAAILISLALSYVPGLRERFDALAGDQKRAVVGASIVLCALLAVALSCAGLAGYTTCDQVGVFNALSVLIAALVASQGAYMLTGGRA